MRLLAPALALAIWLVLAAPALANDNGEGIVGETDDRIITFYSLGVVVFFVLVVITGSAIQARLEKRKEQRKAAELRRRVGW
jgi:peptidoglycan/LPS O-acetylase OafA/YrhL